MDKLSTFARKIHQDMRGARTNWDSHWQEVTDVVIPRKRNVYDHRQQPGGDKRQTKVFDTTAIKANETLASALQGMLTNPSTQWFDLTTGIPELDNRKAVRQWLQKAVRKIIQVLNNTNFQTEIHEVYIDLGSIGTASLRMEEDDESMVRFQARPIYESYVKENHKGMVDTLSRELKLTSRQIKQKFNFEKAAKRLDEMDVMKLNKFDQDADKEWNIIHFVGPKEDFPKELLPASTRRFKIVSLHIVEDLDIVIEAKGFKEFPYAVPRWGKTSGEIYGRGPGITALPDINMINEMMKTHIRAAQKIVDPTLQVPDDGMLLPIKTIPGGINYYRAGTGDRIEPLNTGGRLDISQQIMEDVRRSIREAFFIDQLQLLEGPQMTATEVLQRTEEKLRLLGPVLGRLHFELLKPLIDRVLGIMGRRGELPPNPPAELKDIDLQVEFSSMIARAQKASEADNIQRVVGIMAPFVEAQPEIMDNIDGDGLLKFVGNIFNVPQEMFREEEEVEQTRTNRAQAQQQAADLERQKLESESARNVGLTIGNQ